MKIKYCFWISTASVALIFSVSSFAQAAIDDCKPGYKFNRNSGVGCQQENCGQVPSAHYSYEGYCICGSSGSINENPSDPNKACSYGNEYSSCPGCVYACVHVDEECPETMVASPDAGAATPTQPANDITDLSGMAIPPLIDPVAPPVPEPPPLPMPPPATQQTMEAAAPALTPAPPAPATQSGRTCEQECAKLMRGGPFDEVLEASGTPPNCRCIVDNKDKDNRVTQTIKQDGDIRTTYTFDPATDRLIGKDTISMNAERERIRQLLGYKYDEETIDRMLSDEVIGEWFATRMSDIETDASMLTPAFWWQHIVALWDHGYGNSADFVDTYKFGRCGDSMEWLEREITANLQLNGKHDNKSEAVLSITGEKYNNIINHTALIVRPAGYSNTEWADAVAELTAKTRSGGLTEIDIRSLDPRLLDAKVLDPYFKKQTTVRDFIKGWSVIKIS